MAKKLSKKHEIFVAEYLIDQNATRSAISAGYSAKTAKEQGCRLLTNVHVKALIAEKTSKRLEKLEITADRVLGEIGKVAFLDPRKCFNSDSSVKQIPELDDDTAAAIAGFEFIELFEGTGDQKSVYGILKKFKLADKLSALTLLARNLKLLTDKNEISGKDGGALQFVVTRAGRKE